MTPFIWLWIPFAVMAAGGQVVRNAMQRGLTAKLGTLGATHIRFLFGFPFSLMFLAGILVATGDKLSISDQAGVVYNPLADKWSLSSDMDVNYMVIAEAMG